MTILTHGRKIQVYLMDFIYFPVKFSITGDVSLTKDNLAWSTSNWSDEFKVEYDVIVYSWYNYWANVLHVTTGQNHPRLPAVFFKRTYFNICSHVNGNNDYCQIYNYELNTDYHFEISQNKNPSGEAIYSINVNGETFFEIVNTNPLKFENAKLYLSNPWYPTFGAFGKVSNLKVNADLTQ